MITLRKLTDNNPDILLARELYHATFAASERDHLTSLLKHEPTTLTGIYTGENAQQFAGFCIAAEDENMVYLHYVAIGKEMLAAGRGREVLQALMERFGNKMVMLTNELPPRPGEGDAQGKRRREFYLQNGFHECHWHALYGSRKYIVACSTETVDMDSLALLLRHLTELGKNFYTHDNLTD